MTTERERFEAWAKSNPRWRLEKSRSDDGYMYVPAATAWRAWQAAVSRAQPAAPALPAITEQQSKWGRLYTAANALVVKMGFIGSMQADSTEMESLKDKLHDLDGGEWMPGLMPPAQPAAPADQEISAEEKFCDWHCSWAEHHPDCKLDDGNARLLEASGYVRRDAAPSVAPEPVAWTTLIEIDWVKRNAGRAGSFYAVKAGPNDIPLFAHPPRAPLPHDLVGLCRSMVKVHRECGSVLTVHVEQMADMIDAMDEGAAK